MKISEGIRAFKESHPDFYIIAGDHAFGCHCTPCVCLADDAMWGADEDNPEEKPEPWYEFMDQEIVDDKLSDEQVAQFKDLIQEWT